MAELRRAIVRCGGLPIAISGTGEMQWVAGVAVELLWRWRSGEGELSPVMAMAEALGAAAATAGEEGDRGEATGERG